jgi:hypothetical protein
MTNFFSNCVEMNLLKNRCTSERESGAGQRNVAQTVPRFAGLVVLNLGLPSYAPPG